MDISAACIRRPVMTTLITASLIVFGIFGYRLLAVAALPAGCFPAIHITAPPRRARPRPGVCLPPHPDPRPPPGGEPRNDGRLGRRSDRAAAFHHFRHHLAH